jgi:photosystem II stability/assembly factor-like uncharacterized protein
MRLKFGFFEKTGRRLLRTLMVMGWLIFILNGAQVAMAQWVSHGPYGGRVNAIAIDPKTPTTLYAGGRTVFKSSNGGGSWAAINNGIWAGVSALAIDPQTPTTLYAGTIQAGVYRSSDGGGSWTARRGGLGSLSVVAIAIDPQMPSTLYAGTGDSGVFKSSDGGGNWTATTAIPPGIGPVYALAIDPQTPATIYAGTGAGVSKSNDGGGSWTAINNGLPCCAPDV